VDETDPTGREGVSKLSRRGLLALGATLAGTSGIGMFSGSAAAHDLMAFRDAFVGDDEDKQGLGSKGWLFFAKNTGTVYYHNGSGWVDLGLGGGNGALVDSDDDGLLEAPDHDGIDVGRVDAESVSAEMVGSERYYAGAFDGTDADARLDAALSAASNGDIIYLENTGYSADRTISTEVRLVGTDAAYSNSGINGGWTLDTQNIGLEYIRGNNGSLTVNEGNCSWTDSGVSSSFDSIQVNGNNFRFVNNTSFTTLAFASGASGGVVDSIAGNHSTTDNDGRNTLGDGAN
jgi:hypothetical protein